MVTLTSKTDGGQINQGAVANTSNNTVMCRMKYGIEFNPRNRNIRVKYINYNKPKQTKANKSTTKIKYKNYNNNCKITKTNNKAKQTKKITYTTQPQQVKQQLMCVDNKKKKQKFH